MNDQSNCYGLDFLELSQSLPAYSSEEARPISFQNEPQAEIFFSDEKYSGSEIDWDNLENLQSEAEKAILFQHNALDEDHTTIRQEQITQSEDLAFMVKETEDSQETLLQNQDDDIIIDEIKKKVHVEEESNLVDEIARLEAIVNGCDLWADLSTNDTIHEDQTIQIKVPNKRGRPRKIQAAKSLIETFNDSLAKSKNQYDKIWFQADPMFEHMRIPEDDQVIPNTERIQRKKQNPKRNIPGLIFNREIRNILTVLKKNNSRSKSYILEILALRGCGTDKYPAFINYLEGLQIKTRTWEVIKAKIKENSVNSSNSFFERLLFECIVTFLSSNGQDDFDDWICDPKAKLKEKTKTALFNSKKEFRNEFGNRFGLSLAQLTD